MGGISPRIGQVRAATEDNTVLVIMAKGFTEETNTGKTGRAAEKFAQNYLRARKLSILETNYTTPRGELDIIARDDKDVVFVEVRMRSKSSFGTAADSIGPAKQRRLIYAATHYLQKTDQWDKVGCRFDAICLTPAQPKSGNNSEYQVEWIRNAFNIR